MHPDPDVSTPAFDCLRREGKTGTYSPFPRSVSGASHRRQVPAQEAPLGWVGRVAGGESGRAPKPAKAMVGEVAQWQGRRREEEEGEQEEQLVALLVAGSKEAKREEKSLVIG